MITTTKKTPTFSAACTLQRQSSAHAARLDRLQPRDEPVPDALLHAPALVRPDERRGLVFLDLAIRAELAVALGPGDGGVQQGAAAHLCGAAEEEAQQVDGRAPEQADVAGQVGVAQAGREQVDDDAGAGGGREAGELARGVDLEQLAERVPAESQSRRCWVREARTGLPCCSCSPATGRRRCRRASLRRTARCSGRRSRRLSGAA